MTQHQQCHDTPTHPLTLRSGLQLTEDLTETTLLDEEMWCQSVPNKESADTSKCVVCVLTESEYEYVLEFPLAL